MEDEYDVYSRTNIFTTPPPPLQRSHASPPIMDIAKAIQLHAMKALGGEEV
jgi:hypothetical protein